MWVGKLIIDLCGWEDEYTCGWEDEYTCRYIIYRWGG